MSEELKACPCCGGTAYVTEGYTTNEGAWPHGTFYRVYCGSCQLRQLFHRTALAATTAWNRRTVSGQEAVGYVIPERLESTDPVISLYRKPEGGARMPLYAAPIPATEQKEPK